MCVQGGGRRWWRAGVDWWIGGGQGVGAQVNGGGALHRTGWRRCKGAGGAGGGGGWVECKAGVGAQEGVGCGAGVAVEGEGMAAYLGVVGEQRHDFGRVQLGRVYHGRTQRVQRRLERWSAYQAGSQEGSRQWAGRAPIAVRTEPGRKRAHATQPGPGGPGESGRRGAGAAPASQGRLTSIWRGIGRGSQDAGAAMRGGGRVVRVGRWGGGRACIELVRHVMSAPLARIPRLGQRRDGGRDGHGTRQSGDAGARRAGWPAPSRYSSQKWT